MQCHWFVLLLLTKVPKHILLYVQLIFLIFIKRRDTHHQDIGLNYNCMLHFFLREPFKINTPLFAKNGLSFQFHSCIIILSKKLNIIGFVDCLKQFSNFYFKLTQILWIYWIRNFIPKSRISESKEPLE